MNIGGYDIDSKYRPYLVAEISGNHCGDLSNAIRLVREAKRIGADAVKTQCYEPDTLTLDLKKPDFIIQGGLWKGRTLYDLYSKAYTPFKWHRELYNVAKSEGITIFSSVFDKSGVELLESLECPCYKIASFEIVDIPLIEACTATGKPLIVSTGLATDTEIMAADEASGYKAAFLHCTSEYPAAVENANMGRMMQLKGHLKETPYQRIVGISDHTPGYEVPIMATCLGARIIEKHLKLQNGKSEDDEFSLTPLQFGHMVDAVKTVWEGLKDKDVTANGSRQFRRSLYAVEDIKKGEPYTTKNVRSIRPGYGLPPRMLPNILGKKSKRDWRRGDPLS